MMSNPENTAPEDGEKPMPQRRRGAALEDALLDAAWEELKEVGYYNLTFDGVAARAGTSKAVLYRRWANRLELVRATIRAHRQHVSDETPNTGSLRGDLLALLDRTTIGLSDLQSDIIWGLLMDAINDDAHREALQNTLKNAMRDEAGQSYLERTIHATNIAAMTAILKQAEARGEVTISAIPPRVLTLPFDLARHEMLFTGRPITREAVREIVDQIVAPLLRPAAT